MKTTASNQWTAIRALAARCCFLGLMPAMALAGCHSLHIEVAVENRTGGPIRLLEVDYPNASFGADALGAGATFHYRIQVQGSGPLKVQYAGSGERQVQIQGPALAEQQEGTLAIVLLPDGKANFEPHLSGPRNQ